VLKRILWILTAFAICSPAKAGALFEACNDLVGDSSYKPLQEYFSTTYRHGDFCQRLNNHEFLYTNANNFFYCQETKEKYLSCSEDQPGRWYPELSIVKRFDGANGKKFVLFKTSRLAHGFYSEGYSVFFLGPKGVSPRGYVILSLGEAGASNGLYSDEGKICSNMRENDNAVTPIDDGFQIINENKNNVVIRFNQEITSCASGEKATQTLEYTWLNNSFQQTLNSKVKK